MNECNATLCPRHGDPRDTNVKDPERAPCIQTERDRRVVEMLDRWDREGIPGCGS